MKAILKDKKEVAKATFIFVYDLLGEKVDFIPGQYFHVKLSENIKHHFTILNSPNEKGIISHATRMRDTEFKNTLKELPIGTEVEIYKIKGEFVLPENTDIPFVFIALGIGITPFISMVRYIKEEKLNHRISLIYSDSDKESMAFFDELNEYSHKNPNFKLILTVTKDKSWKAENRHVDGEFLEKYFEKPKDNIYYVSGPPKSVESVSMSLEKSGILKDNIKSEIFTGY